MRHGHVCMGMLCKFNHAHGRFCMDMLACMHALRAEHDGSRQAALSFDHRAEALLQAFSLKGSAPTTTSETDCASQCLAGLPMTCMAANCEAPSLNGLDLVRLGGDCARACLQVGEVDPRSAAWTWESRLQEQSALCEHNPAAAAYFAAQRGEVLG